MSSCVLQTSDSDSGLLDIVKSGIGLPVDLLGGSYAQGGLSFGKCPTAVKVQRSVLNFLSLASPYAAYQLTHNVAWTCASLLGSVGFAYLSSHIKDYQDPLELKNMRKEALNLSWKGLVKEHSLSSLSLVLKQKDIVAKFEEFFAGSSFSEIIQKHSLDEIQKYSLSSISKDSFLSHALIRELGKSPISLLRNWGSCNWNSEGPLYRKLIPADQLSSLISIQKSISKIDNDKFQALKNLDRMYRNRTERWKKDLRDKRVNVNVDAKTFRNLIFSPLYDLSKLVFSGVDLQSKDVAVWDRRAADYAKDKAERDFALSLYLKIFLEQINPESIAKAEEEQKLYDNAVQQVNLDHEFQINTCKQQVLDLISR